MNSSKCRRRRRASQQSDQGYAGRPIVRTAAWRRVARRSKFNRTSPIDTARSGRDVGDHAGLFVAIVLDLLLDHLLDLLFDLLLLGRIIALNWSWVIPSLFSIWANMRWAGVILANCRNCWTIELSWLDFGARFADCGRPNDEIEDVAENPEEASRKRNRHGKPPNCRLHQAMHMPCGRSLESSLFFNGLAAQRRLTKLPDEAPVRKTCRERIAGLCADLAARHEYCITPSSILP